MDHFLSAFNTVQSVPYDIFGGTSDSQTVDAPEYVSVRDPLYYRKICEQGSSIAPPPIYTGKRLDVRGADRVFRTSGNDRGSILSGGTDIVPFSSTGLADPIRRTKSGVLKNAHFSRKKCLQSKIFYVILSKLFKYRRIEGVTVSHVLRIIVR